MLELIKDKSFLVNKSLTLNSLTQSIKSKCLNGFLKSKLLSGLHGVEDLEHAGFQLDEYQLVLGHHVQRLNVE